MRNPLSKIAFSIGLVVLTLLLLCYFSPKLLTAQSSPALSHHPDLERAPLEWHNGVRTVRVWMSKKELALFSKADTSSSALEGALSTSFEPGVRATKKSGALAFCQSQVGYDRSLMKQKIQSLKQSGLFHRVSPVFYSDPKKASSSRMVPTTSFFVGYVSTCTEGDIAEMESQYSLEKGTKIPHLKNTYLYEGTDIWQIVGLVNFLKRDSRVLYSYPNCQRTPRRKMAPNDTYYPSQWHLKNTGSPGQGNAIAGEDIANGQMESVWNSYTGLGIVVAVVDDGIEKNHPDLSANVSTAASYDYVDANTDPTPDVTNPANNHGTACAGLIGAVGNNSIGVLGVAFQAKLAGMRYIGTGNETEANEINTITRGISGSTAFDVSSNSWGYSDDTGKDTTVVATAVLQAFEQGVTNGRGGRGIIYLFAAGNGGDVKDRADLDSYVASRFTIAVGACDSQGKLPWYSEEGSCILIVAPGGAGDYTGWDLCTTDFVGTKGENTGASPGGDYLFGNTTGFTGTSAATPVAAGCVALMLQANPYLTWRDVQHILVNTATKNDPTEAGWTVNGAGKPINYKYGFGRVNVKATIDLAKTWTSVGTNQSSVTGSANPSMAIPDNNTAGVDSLISLPSGINIEHVEVAVNITHTRWTDLEIVLKSPWGTESLLAWQKTVTPYAGTGFNGYTFTTVRHWGETSGGTWTLSVRDKRSASTGTLVSWSIKAFGAPSGGSTPPPSGTGSSGGGSKGGCSLSSGPMVGGDILCAFLPLLGLLFMLFLLGQRREREFKI